MKIIVLLIILSFTCLVWVGTASAQGPLSLEVRSSNYVPGEQGNYMLFFQMDRTLELSVSASVYADFPHGYELFTKECDWSKAFQYLNPNSQEWTTVSGYAAIEGSRFLFNITEDNLLLDPNIQMRLVLSDVLNGPQSGVFELSLTLLETNGNSISKTVDVVLGPSPAEVPSGLALTAVSSLQVNAVWGTVAGADRYQLFFSSEVNENYQPACNNCSSLNTEEWYLTTPSIEFKGNDYTGLEAGKTYYFKVRAGNQFGYGPFSQPVPVTTLSVKLLQTLPADKETKVLIKNPVLALFNQKVNVVNPNEIQVAELPYGSLVDSSQISVEERTVVIAVQFEYDTAYQVVFGERALESTVHAAVYNPIFRWTFTTEAKPESSGDDHGDGGGEDHSDSGG
ncbi:MAG: fibronectin type III domain-containing protein [Desulfotomaculaceae bacterium]|nr:fibronectin type III domain-containing protein [Desulfotomaculaceae bacterium]